jgi:hypothetical protein
MGDKLVKRARRNALADMPHHASVELIEVMADRIEQLEAKLAKAVEALDEAVYLLAPDDKDMARKAGVYRIVTTLAALKGQANE